MSRIRREGQSTLGSSSFNSSTTCLGTSNDEAIQQPSLSTVSRPSPFTTHTSARSTSEFPAYTNISTVASGGGRLTNTSRGSQPEIRFGPLNIPKGTLRLCPNYGESRGKCDDPNCPSLHLCRAWLAG